MLSVDLYNKEGCTEVTGVDYSPAAVDLARKVAQQEDLRYSLSFVTYLRIWILLRMKP